MLCRELMERNVRFCAADEPIARVARMMRDYSIGLVPVCDADRKIVGVLTDRDLAVRVLAEGRGIGDTLASEVMSRDVIACHPHDDVQVAEQLMAREKIGRVVVIDDEGQLVGVISLSDLMQIESDERASRLFRAIASRESAFLLV